MTPDPTITYTVISRHSEKDCSKKRKDPETGKWKLPPRTEVGCNCLKSIAVYDSTKTQHPKGLIQFRIKTKTRVFAEAELIAQTYRDKLDPTKRALAEAEAKLKAQKAEKESQSATIEKAVSAFLIWKFDNPSRRSSKLSGKTSDSAMTGYRTLLGYVENGEVRRKGHLFTWLGNLTPQNRPLLISDLTPVLVDAFRASWRGMNDLVTSKNFTRLKAFFDYCVERGKWIKENPLDGVSQPSVKDGQRTTAFTSEQYQSILETRPQPWTVENHRLLTLVELMRWSGMAIIDAVNFDRSTLTGNELRSRRQKTGVKAMPNLASHVVEMLRNVVPINGDPDQPFRDVRRTIKSDIGYWRPRIKQLFADAGLKTVKTDVGIRPTHPHMLRHTFATLQLKTQYDLGKVNLQTIADAMGDSIATFTTTYKHWIDELETAHRQAQNAIVEAQEAQLANGRAK